MLTFDFGTVVELTGVVMSFWNGNDLDIFDLFIDDILVASNISSLVGLTSELLTGTVFGFGSDGDGCVVSGWRDGCSDAGFKVMSLSVEPVSEIPVPAALPLLGAGLVGLGVMGRRRKVAATA
jgi:hypothetical protein